MNQADRTADSLPARLKMRAELNVDGDYKYVGTAYAGTATSVAKWRIKLMTYDVNKRLTAIDFADGSAEFDKVWNNRATYSYS